MNKIYTVIIFLTFVSFSSFAQKKNSKKDCETYYVTKAQDEFEKHNVNNALELVELELKSNPANYKAHYIASQCQMALNNLSASLSSVNKCLDNQNKKDDPKSYAIALAWRGRVYAVLGDTARAVVDLTKSIDLSPNAPAYSYRSDIYLAQKNYDMAVSDADKLIEQDPANASSYAVLANCYAAQKNYDEAVKYANFALKLNPENSSLYADRSSYYEHKKDYSNAAKDLLSTIVYEQTPSNTTYQAVCHAASLYMPQLEREIKRAVYIAKGQGTQILNYYLAEAYRTVNLEEKAIPLFSAMIEESPNSNIMARMAACYNVIGQFDEALSILEKAIALEKEQNPDATNLQWFTSLKVSILDDAGRGQEAIDILTDIIDNQVPDAMTYYRRAWIRQYQGEYEAAIADFTQAISMDPEGQLHSMLTRGNLRRLTGDEAGAREDFEFVANLSDDDGDMVGNRLFAFHYLGDDNRARKAMEDLLAKDPSTGNYYNAACLESLMQNKDMAIAYLDSAFTKGYVEFNHIARDRDLDNVRNTQEFKDLVALYKEKLEDRRNHKGLLLLKKSVDALAEERVVEVPFTKDGNMCKVKCQVNGLPLHFIFDTGASDVSISSVEASFMMKNEYLSRSDIRGSQNYMNANGDISTGTIINLREVKLNEELSLSDVRASVTHNQSAPLLLGQSVLERLGKIEIDNEKKVLRITYTKKSK